MSPSDNPRFWVFESDDSQDRSFRPPKKRARARAEKGASSGLQASGPKSPYQPLMKPTTAAQNFSRSMPKSTAPTPPSNRTSKKSARLAQGAKSRAARSFTTVLTGGPYHISEYPPSTLRTRLVQISRGQIAQSHRRQPPLQVRQVLAIKPFTTIKIATQLAKQSVLSKQESRKKVPQPKIQNGSPSYSKRLREAAQQPCSSFKRHLGDKSINNGIMHNNVKAMDSSSAETHEVAQHRSRVGSYKTPVTRPNVIDKIESSMMPRTNLLASSKAKSSGVRKLDEEEATEGSVDMIVLKPVSKIPRQRYSDKVTANKATLKVTPNPKQYLESYTYPPTSYEDGYCTPEARRTYPITPDTSFDSFVDKLTLVTPSKTKTSTEKNALPTPSTPSQSQKWPDATTPCRPQPSACEDKANLLRTQDQPIHPVTPVSNAIRADRKLQVNSEPTDPAIQALWAVLLQPLILDVIAESSLDSIINDATPWEYLISKLLPQVPPEEQVVILEKGLESGYLLQGTLVSIALRNSSADSDMFSTVLNEHLNFAKLLNHLSGITPWHLASVFAAFNFSTVIATRLTSKERGEAQSKLMHLDMILFDVIQKEFCSWKMRDLACYYRRFYEVRDHLRASYGLCNVYEMTLGWLRSKHGGIDNWDLAKMQIAEVLFYSQMRRGNQ